MTHLYESKTFIACPDENPDCISQFVVDRIFDEWGRQWFRIFQLDDEENTNFHNATPVKDFSAPQRAIAYIDKFFEENKA